MTIIDESEESLRKELQSAKENLQRMSRLEHSQNDYINHLEKIIYEATFNPSFLKKWMSLLMICNTHLDLGINIRMNNIR